MIINNEQNMEYGIWNMESKIQDSVFPNFSPTRHSTFGIRHSAHRGFTLVETLVAIAILLIAVVGPISLIGDALHKLYYAKDQMVAINLAQEGIEVVRQERDSDMLAGSASDIFSLTSPYYYTVNASSASLNISTAGQKPVYLNGDFYEQSGGTATQFTRLITITSVGSGTTERKVTSTVEWKTGGQTGTITVSEYLFKWAIP